MIEFLIGVLLGAAIACLEHRRRHDAKTRLERLKTLQGDNDAVI